MTTAYATTRPFLAVDDERIARYLADGFRLVTA